MINSVKLHDDLWSISLASMFNWTSSVRPQNVLESVNPDGNGSGGISSKSEVGELNHLNQQDIQEGEYNFPFGGGLTRLPECNSIKNKIMKHSGGKSFTIDSLLGIKNAAQVAIQSILPGNHHQFHGEDSENNKWVLEKHQYELHGREGRFNPYHLHHRKERLHNLSHANSSSVSSDKGGEKPQKVSRRSTKSKRVRTIFTPEQLERLEAEFERQQYMVGPERLYLASSLYLTEAQVKVWFQNRRIKWRKQHLEMQQQRLAVFRSKGEEDDEGDEYEEESDGSTSVTLPPADSSYAIMSNMPLLTSFSGSLDQSPPELTSNCSSRRIGPHNENKFSHSPFSMHHHQASAPSE